MIAKLIWKEWREQRWKLALGCVVLIGFTMIALRARMAPDVEIMIGSILLGGLFLPVFVGMDIVAGERAGGSMSSLLKLPIRPWKILAVKLALGVSICIIPILATGALACLMAGGRELTTSYILQMYAGTLSMCITVLIFTVCLGIGQPNEARVAVIGMLVMSSWVSLGTLWCQFRPFKPYYQRLDWIMFQIPWRLWLIIIPRNSQILAVFISVQIVALSLLCFWGAIRFDKAGRAGS